MFTPKLEILPPAQRRLWDELRHTPEHFVLYGGTALALRLAHRSSEDFDFFSNYSFAPDSLRKAIPYLHDAEMSQFQANTLTAIVDRDRTSESLILSGPRVESDTRSGSNCQTTEYKSRRCSMSQRQNWRRFNNAHKREITRILRRSLLQESVCLTLWRRLRLRMGNSSMAP